MNASFLKGQEALKAGNKQQAIQWLRQAMSENPKDPAVWVELANAVDELDKKKECLRQALKISPSYPLAQIALSKLENPPVAHPQVISPPAPLPDWFNAPAANNTPQEMDDPFALEEKAPQAPPRGETRYSTPYKTPQASAPTNFSTENMPAWIWAIVGVAGLTLVAGLISVLYAYTSNSVDTGFTSTISNLAGSILYAALFAIAAFLAYQAVLQLKLRWQEMNNPIISILLFFSITKLTTDALYKPLSDFLYSSVYGEADLLGFSTQCLEGLVVIGALLAGSYYIIRNNQ